MTDDFEDITAAPSTGPLSLKEVQSNPALMGPEPSPSPAAAKPEPEKLPEHAPWFQCWNVDEAHPNDGSQYSVESGQGREVRTSELHPPFQSLAIEKGQHPLCPVCGRKTVMRLEGYVPPIPA
jgi:hypothetical protein